MKLFGLLPQSEGNYTYGRVRNPKFARNLKFATSKTLVNFMKKMMFLSKNWYFSVQKVLIYHTVNKFTTIDLFY